MRFLLLYYVCYIGVKTQMNIVCLSPSTTFTLILFIRDCSPKIVAAESGTIKAVSENLGLFVSGSRPNSLLGKTL